MLSIEFGNDYISFNKNSDYPRNCCDLWSSETKYKKHEEYIVPVGSIKWKHPTKDFISNCLEEFQWEKKKKKVSHVSQSKQ